MVVVCHVNVRSLVADGRLLEVSSLVSFNNVDILCLSETWLKPKHLSSTLLLPGFQPPVRRDRVVDRGGGVAIYLRDGLAFKNVPIVPTDIECIVVDVSLPRRKKLTVVTCYRPPHQCMDAFTDSLENVLSSIRSVDLCVVGDFNAKHSDWYSSQPTDKNGAALKCLTDGFNLHQVISLPTYNTAGANPVLLDLVFVSKPSSVVSSAVLPPLSDHCVVVVHLSLKKAPPLKPYSKIYWDYANADVDALRQLLSSCSWDSLSSADVNTAVFMWQRAFLDTCSLAIPKLSRHVYPSSKPWYSSYLKYLARCRDRLFHRSRKCKDGSRVWTAYRKVRNLFVSELRASQKRYFLDLGFQLTSRRTNPRRWWSLAKRACGWSVPRCLPAILMGDSVVTEPFAKACCLNSQFQKQCSACEQAQPALLRQLLSVYTSGPCFTFQEISSAAVASAIRHLSNWKSCGLDGITNMLLKLAADEVCTPLSMLFNRSLDAGIFPDVWKEAIVTPVPKEGKDYSTPESYRPIALLSCPSKVLERFVADQLTAFCFEHDILPAEQFGFLKGRSSEWQLLTVLEEWHNALDKHSCVHAAFLDAAKAFDRVDHPVLLERLAEIGVQGTALKWFHSYLSGRHIRTRVNGVESFPLPISSGVPQGSCLGPLLFLIYFKDIPSVVSAASALFADDTLIYRCDCKGQRQTPCCQLGRDLSDLEVWADSSRVKFNAAKSAEFCVGASSPDRSVELVGTTLPRAPSRLHLGVLLEGNLRWTSHIECLLRLVSGPVTLCMRLTYSHHLPPSVTRKFYLAYIRTRLEYCSAVWGGAPPVLLKKLERIQLKVARLLVAPNNGHDLRGSALLQAVGLPTLTWRRRIHRLTVMWKLVHGFGPPQLACFLPQPASSRSTRDLRAPHRLEFPSSNSSRHLSSFLCVVVPEWNCLPSDVVNSSTVGSFVSRIRQFFRHDRFVFGL